MGWTLQNIIARLVIIEGENDGLFVYDGPPAAGNLIASIAAASGTDLVGNGYLIGSTVYLNEGSHYLALQMYAGNLSWWVNSSFSGIYSQLNQIGIDASTGAVAVTNGFELGSTPGQREIWVNPSGDVTGSTDSAAIAAALSTARAVHLQPGLFYINTPIIMDTSYQVLQGAGMPFATTIVCAFTSFQNQMLLVSGATAPLFETTVRDLALKGSVFVGHGIVFRSNGGLIENVTVQGNGLSGDCFHLSLDALTPANVFDVTLINCFAMQPGSTGTGFLLDSNFDSCELHVCRAQGGTAAASPGAAWGFQLLGGEIKLVTCHAFEFLTGGANLGGTSGHQIIGGEYETNAGPGIEINGGVTDCKIIGPSLYGNTGTQDISIGGAAAYNTITAATFESSAVTSAITLDSTVTHCGITNCRSKAAKGINASSGADYQIISLNDLNGATITHSGAHDIVTSNL